MRLLSFDELRTVKGIRFSRPHIYRLIKAGKFPRPIRLGENRVAFADTEIDAHIAALIRQRDATDRNAHAASVLRSQRQQGEPVPKESIPPAPRQRNYREHHRNEQITSHNAGGETPGAGARSFHHDDERPGAVNTSSALTRSKRDARS